MDIMSKYKRYAVIDTDTGEVMTEVLKKNNEELRIGTVRTISEEQRKAHYKRKIIESLNKIESDAMKNLGKEYEGFVLMYYVKDQLLLKTTGLDYQDIARTLYLGTHLGYGENTGNMLVVKRNQRVIEPMTRPDMMNVLGLSDKPLRTFINNAKKCGVLQEVEKKFYLSEEYFTKGIAKKGSNEYTRLYIKPIKNLFENVKSKDHKSIGMIMSLIPFLNYDWNYLEKSNGEYMTLQEMNDLLGGERSHASRLFKRLRGLNIPFGNSNHKIITQMVLNQESDEREERIYINPMIVYRGKSPEYHHEIVKQMLFNTSNKVNKNLEKKSS